MGQPEVASGQTTKNKTATSVSKTKGTSKNTAPKIKAGAPTAHKMDYDQSIDKYSKICEQIISLVPKIRLGELNSKQLQEEVFKGNSYNSYLIPLCNSIVEASKLESEILSYAKVNAVITNQRAIILMIVD